MTAPDRYGQRKVPRMYAEINTLRAAIRAEGTPAIQEAWDAVEEHIDFAYSRDPAAALELPEVKALVEAAKEVDATVNVNNAARRRLSAALAALNPDAKAAP